WINKYYIMDLAPGRSFLEWAITHERTVFAISYRNPDPSMSGVTLDDYLVNGPQTALGVITDITGAPKVDIVGLCLGGALTGVLGAFTDEATVSRLEKQMEKQGVLEGRQMATTFDALRPNDLIFNYVVSNWLLGQDPPAFDILPGTATTPACPPPCTRSTCARCTCATNLPVACSRSRVSGCRWPTSATTSTR